MKILLICNKVPYPANDGSSIAMRSMIDGFLQNKTEIRVLCLNTVKHYRTKEDINRHRPENLDMTVIEADTNVKVSSALSNLFRSDPYHVSRFLQPAFKKALEEKLQQFDFDIVQVEGLSMAVYVPLIRQLSQAKIVLRTHNVEHRIWQRHVQHEKNIFKKWYLNLQTSRLQKFEENIPHEIDGLVAISKHDLKEFYGFMPEIPSIHIPCGINTNDVKPCNDKAKTDIGYLASFDWLPNVQGVYWFLDNVWPLLKKEKPDIIFHLGGRNMPLRLQKLADTDPNLKISVDVPEMRDFVCSNRLMVIPLLAGSGIRIKIIENMALAKCLVSTSIGAEGILYNDRVDMAIADFPQDFADCILYYLQNDEERVQMEKAARKTIEEKYDNRHLGAELLQFYADEIC